MITFEKPGAINTEVTLKLAIQTAQERGMDLVVATSKGNTACRAAELCKEMGFEHQLVAVTCAYGHRGPNENGVSEETRILLQDQGVKVVTAAHALSGAERGISKVFGGVYPVEIMAATVVGGTAGGADTACIITPAYTACLLETKVNEILCKPSLME